MGLFKKKKGRKSAELRDSPPGGAGSKVRMFNTLEQMAHGENYKMHDDSSLEDVAKPIAKFYVEPPPAREAAFHGPPRFDWIDVETTAAIKIQSIHRRNQTMKNLEDQGLSTSAIRNRKRRRKAAKSAHPYSAAQTQDTPGVFACCAVGLAFGDATEGDDDAYRQMEKRKYEERHKQQAAHEEALRRQYMSKHGINPGKVVEALEIVD